jgi:predicted ATP-dependent Lon-type protease
VHKITEEENWETIKTAFERFKKNKKIVCASIPVVSSEKYTYYLFSDR